MSHVQKRCRGCARTVPPRASSCPACGGQDPVWRARYRAPDGYEKSRTFARRTDAERWLAEMQVAKARGSWVDPSAGRVSVAEWSERWLAGRAHSLKPKTEEGYRSILRSRILPAFGQWKVADLRPSDVQAWIAGMQGEGLSPSRIRQSHVVLSMILKSAVREGLVPRNVAEDVDLPRIPHREAAYLEPQDVERIAQQMAEPYDLLVRILGTLGLRFGEAAALRRRSVDLLRKRLVIEESVAEVRGKLLFGPTKTHAMRRVPIPSGLLAAIQHHLDERVPSDPEALLFTASEGGPLRHSSFYHRPWRTALLRTSLPRVGVHVLRHSAAAALIHSGASAKAVQTILGHQSAAFTLTVYGHVFDADLDEVVAGLERSLSLIAARSIEVRA